jgi:hypothetical protein
MGKVEQAQVMVRVAATPKLEIRLGYFDIYPYVYEDIYEFVKPSDRREMGALLDEECCEAIAYVKLDTKTLCEIYDRLSIQFAEECKRLNKECDELSSRECECAHGENS